MYSQLAKQFRKKSRPRSERGGECVTIGHNRTLVRATLEWPVFGPLLTYVPFLYQTPISAWALSPQGDDLLAGWDHPMSSSNLSTKVAKEFAVLMPNLAFCQGKGYLNQLEFADLPLVRARSVDDLDLVNQAVVACRYNGATRVSAPAHWSTHPGTESPAERRWFDARTSDATFDAFKTRVEALRDNLSPVLTTLSPSQIKAARSCISQPTVTSRLDALLEAIFNGDPDKVVDKCGYLVSAKHVTEVTNLATPAARVAGTALVLDRFASKYGASPARALVGAEHWMDPETGVRYPVSREFSTAARLWLGAEFPAVGPAVYLHDPSKR